MPPMVISHYRVVRRLGVGGMGEVYLAQDTQLERWVARKVMSAELAKDPNQRKRFRTEAKAASGLSQMLNLQRDGLDYHFGIAQV